VTYEELINQVVKETVDIVDSIDDGFQISDLGEVVEAAVKWKSAISAAGMAGDDFTVSDLLFHVISRLPAEVVAKLKPIPEGELPESE
jgi:hypothetical protein